MSHAPTRPASAWRTLSREQKQARLAGLRRRQQQQVAFEGRLLGGLSRGR